MSEDWLVMPPRTMTAIAMASTSTASSTSPAPAARGRPRRYSALMTGAVTEAMIIAVINGMTITRVSASTDMTPTTMSPMPTISHATMPASRTHLGVENNPLSSRDSMLKGLGRPPRGLSCLIFLEAEDVFAYVLAALGAFAQVPEEVEPGRIDGRRPGCRPDPCVAKRLREPLHARDQVVSGFLHRLAVAVCVAAQ